MREQQRFKNIWSKSLKKNAADFYKVRRQKSRRLQIFSVSVRQLRQHQRNKKRATGSPGWSRDRANLLTTLSLVGNCLKRRKYLEFAFRFSKSCGRWSSECSKILTIPPRRGLVNNLFHILYIFSNIVGWFQNMKLVYSCTPYQYIICIIQYMQYVIFILRNKWEVWRFHNSSPPNIFRPPRSNNSGYKCGPIYETFTFIHLYCPLTIAKLSHFSPSKLIWIHETSVVVLPNLYV